MEEHVFRDRVLTVLATVEQTYWEVVFANENLKVAEAALKAAQELLASNRAKAKAGIMSIVDVLQAEAAVASRVEQVLVADKTIRDQEDQLRRLLNPAEEDLRQDLRLTPLDQPVVTLEAISLQEAIDTAFEQRPEIVQAKKIWRRAISTPNLRKIRFSRPSRSKERWEWQGSEVATATR